MTMTMLIADIALAVTVVLGLGSIAAVALRRGSPALRHAAWRATLAGVWLAPVAVIVAGMLPVQRPEIAVPVPRYEPAPAPVAEAPPAPVEEPMAPAPQVAPAAEPAPAPREPLPIAAILLGLWGAGALVALVAFGRDATALRTLLAEGAPSDRPATVEAIAQRLGLARLPRVRRSAEVSVPAVAGWLRPTLVLPEDGRADEAALIHELAHVQRGDVPTLAAARLTAAVWWWHPLAWLMLRGLAATAEEACDDVVLALTGARREYAQMLTDWAERTSVAGAVNCGSRGRGLVTRVRRVLDEHVRPVTRLSGLTRVGVIAGALVAVVAAGAFGLRAAAPDADGITTVLLMGVDARPEKNDRGRADAIMVLFVNPETDRAALLSLPRDLGVTIPHIGQNKLNAAYPMGGPELVRETVEDVLGIAIDHHVQLDMRALPEVVDALGGVTIDVPDVEGSGRGMNYDDASGDLHIHLEPGMQHLDGEQALGYVTYRKGDSDFARQKRQQQLLRALLQQKLRDRPVVELTETVPPMAEAVETDMSWRELIDLARVLREVPEEGLLATDMTEYLRDLHVGGVYYVDFSLTALLETLVDLEDHLDGELIGPTSDRGFAIKITDDAGNLRYWIFAREYSPSRHNLEFVTVLDFTGEKPRMIDASTAEWVGDTLTLREVRMHWWEAGAEEQVEMAGMVLEVGRGAPTAGEFTGSDRAGRGGAFSLRIYSASELEMIPAFEDWRWDAMEKVQGSWRLFRSLDQNRTRYFMAPIEPAFTEEDFEKVRQMDRRGLEEHRSLSFEMKDRAAFREWTGKHIEQRLLFVLNGNVVSAPVIKAPIPGSGIIQGLTEEQATTILDYFQQRATGTPVNGFLMPVDGQVISDYGPRINPTTGTRRFHAGIDIAAPEGTPIKAAGDGTVIGAGWQGAYGRAVTIDHGGGWATLYGHCSELLIEEGQAVRCGEVVAKVGSSGVATGPHLQWNVYRNGETVDPLDHSAQGGDVGGSASGSSHNYRYILVQV